MGLKPALPNLSSAVRAWGQQLEFIVVAKNKRDFKEVEVFLPRKAFGSRYPMSAQRIALKPEGQRAWKWEVILSTPTLVLQTDDIVEFDKVRYRVMGKTDYSEYGYVEYEIAQDYKR